MPPKSCCIFIWALWLWQIGQMTHIHRHTLMDTLRHKQRGGWSTQGGTRQRQALAIKPSRDGASGLPWAGQYLLPLWQDAVGTGSRRASNMNDIYKAAVCSHITHSAQSVLPLRWGDFSLLDDHKKTNKQKNKTCVWIKSGFWVILFWFTAIIPHRITLSFMMQGYNFTASYFSCSSVKYSGTCALMCPPSACSSDMTWMVDKSLLMPLAQHIASITSWCWKSLDTVYVSRCSPTSALSELIGATSLTGQVPGFHSLLHPTVPPSQG